MKWHCWDSRGRDRAGLTGEASAAWHAWPWTQGQQGWSSKVRMGPPGTLTPDKPALLDGPRPGGFFEHGIRVPECQLSSSSSAFLWTNWSLVPWKVSARSVCSRPKAEEEIITISLQKVLGMWRSSVLPRCGFVKDVEDILTQMTQSFRG